MPTRQIPGAFWTVEKVINVYYDPAVKSIMVDMESDGYTRNGLVTKTMNVPLHTFKETPNVIIESHAFRNFINSHQSLE